MKLSWPRKMLGLPLHPMLVHFPLALWLTAPVFDVLSLTRQPDPWWNIGLYMTAAGVAVGLVAVQTGLLDYIHLSETGSNDVRLAARHGVRTSAVWFVMTAKLIAAVVIDVGTGFRVACLVVDLACAALLIQAGIFGTRITYGKYGND